MAAPGESNLLPWPRPGVQTFHYGPPGQSDLPLWPLQGYQRSRCWNIPIFFESMRLLLKGQSMKNVCTMVGHLPKDHNIHAVDLLQLEEKGQSSGGRGRSHHGIRFEFEYLDEFELIFETAVENEPGVIRLGQGEAAVKALVGVVLLCLSDRIQGQVMSGQHPAIPWVLEFCYV